MPKATKKTAKTELSITSVRIPTSTLNAVRALSLQENRSINSFFVDALTAQVGKVDKKVVSKALRSYKKAKKA